MTEKTESTREVLRRSRVIAVINGKGGVLKTSIVANAGGELARRGFHVLLIDLDISGNLKLDVGVRDGDDFGRNVVDAIWSGGETPLRPVKNAAGREGLDFLFGGRALEMVGAIATSSNADHLPAGSVPAQFRYALAQLCDTEDYDLVLIDCPPGNGDLQDVALAAAQYLVIPTKTDEASLDGLRGVGPRVRKAREGVNPDLTYLGVVITSHNRAATRVLRQVQERLEGVGDTLTLFTSTIRHSQATAHDCRTRGQLAFELAHDASTVQAQRLEALHQRRKAAPGEAKVIPLPAAISGTADDLAGDYVALVDEMVHRIAVTEAKRERA
jgi:chromosome partitioning protein